MKKLMIALAGLSTLAICLTGCQGLKPFPTRTIIEYDAKNKVCGEYRVIKFDPIQVEHVRDLEKCPDIFGFRALDIPKVLDWVDDVSKRAKECK